MFDRFGRPLTNPLDMKPTEPPASSAQSTDAWDRAAASNELDAPLRLKNDADVVAAVPYLLGFQPRESIVALVFRDKTLITTVRFPIELADVLVTDKAPDADLRASLDSQGIRVLHP